jgi:hypothetical protein
LVALWCTVVAPCSSGRRSAGETKVLSTRRASPRRRAIAASPGRSVSRSSGFETASAKIARVASVRAASTAAASVVSAKVTRIPHRAACSRSKASVVP